MHGDYGSEVESLPVVRPNPLRWVGYAFGGGLPPRHKGWVRYDTTTRTWVWRHAARALLQLAVLAVIIIAVLPGPFWIRGLSAFGGLLLGLFYSFGYMIETTEHRLVKAGFPAGTGEAAHLEAARLRDLRRTAANRARRSADADRRRKRAARRAGTRSPTS